MPGPDQFHYAAFGSLISSNIRLPGLARVKSGGSSDAAAKIRVSWCQERTQSKAADAQTAGWDRQVGLARWSVPGRVEFELSHSGESFDCLARGSVDEVGYFFSRAIIPRIVCAAGLGWLQASAVVYAQTALAVVGPSASGKSAVAAALLECGAELLSDHGLAVTTQSGMALAHPGQQDLHLCADALPRDVPCEPVTPGAARCRLDDLPRCGRPLPIGAFIVPLYAAQARESSLVQIRGRDRVNLVLSQGAARAPDGDPGLWLRLANQVSVIALYRPAIPMQARFVTPLAALLRSQLAELLAD